MARGGWSDRSEGAAAGPRTWAAGHSGCVVGRKAVFAPQRPGVAGPSGRAAKPQRPRLAAGPAPATAVRRPAQLHAVPPMCWPSSSRVRALVLSSACPRPLECVPSSSRVRALVHSSACPRPLGRVPLVLASACPCPLACAPSSRRPGAFVRSIWVAGDWHIASLGVGESAVASLGGCRCVVGIEGRESATARRCRLARWRAESQASGVAGRFRCLDPPRRWVLSRVG